MSDTPPTSAIVRDSCTNGTLLFADKTRNKYCRRSASFQCVLSLSILTARTPILYMIMMQAILTRSLADLDII
jgi:hypothetical protein